MAVQHLQRKGLMGDEAVAVVALVGTLVMAVLVGGARFHLQTELLDLEAVAAVAAKVVLTATT
jgi:hypothetical protein